MDKTSGVSPTRVGPVRSNELTPITRRQFGKVATALGLNAALFGWGAVLRDGEVPTLDRVIAKAIGINEAHAANPPRYKLRLGTNLTKKSDEIQRVGFFEFADSVAKLTNGEVQVEVVSGGAICGELTCSQKVAGQVIEMGVNSSQNGAPTFPYYNVLDFAFLWPTRASFLHFLYSPSSDRLFRKTVREKYNIEWLWSHIELRNVFLGLKYKDAELVKRPEGIRGAKLRITGSQMGKIALTQFGANPVPVAWEETLEGLKSGLIDGQETWTTAVAAFGMSPVLAQEIMIEFFPGSMHGYIRADALQRLPTAHREAIMEAGFLTQQWTQKYNEESILKNVSVRQSKLTRGERKAWEDVASPQSNPKPWEEWRASLTKIAGFDAYPELYKLARELPEDTAATAVPPRRWWKQA